MFIVTLHTEGVDRNCSGQRLPHLQPAVTLHTEGVDRNSSLSFDQEAM